MIKKCQQISGYEYVLFFNRFAGKSFKHLTWTSQNQTRDIKNKLGLAGKINCCAIIFLLSTNYTNIRSKALKTNASSLFAKYLLITQ